MQQLYYNVEKGVGFLDPMMVCSEVAGMDKGNFMVEYVSRALKAEVMSGKKAILVPYHEQ
jgi:hypothetical protein